jgi:V8-like Glu-specific endopeptidase
MNPTRINHIANATVAMVSRRQTLRSLGGAALAGIAWPERSWGRAAGPSTRAPSMARTSPRIVPDVISPHPIPLGGNRFLMNGRVVVVDLESTAAAFRDGGSTFPLLVDEATYELTPSLVARAAQIATPMATPVAPGVPPAGPPLFEPFLGELLETMCGDIDDSQDVELYDGGVPGISVDFVKSHQSMVGVLRWKGDLINRYSNAKSVNGKRVCSGTLIANNLFLTAGHCITPPAHLGYVIPTVLGTSTPISKEESATNMKVEFDFQLDPDGNTRPSRPFNVVKLEEHELSNVRDYAILRLEGNPGQDYGMAPVAVIDPPCGSGLCVIGHPQGQEKRIAAGTAADVVANWILYSDLDTIGGNSGSGVLESPEGPVIGVHIGGGCDDVNEGGTNYGVRVGALLQVSPILRDLVWR